MKSHQIDRVRFNNRSRVLRVRVAGRDRVYVVPYGMAEIEGLVQSAEIDRETKCAGFLWTTRAGVEGAMLAEEVLWIHHDPEIHHQHLLYELTLEASRRRQQQDVSIRALAEMIGTSPARIHTLLKPTVYKNKSIKAMAALLSALGADIDFHVRDRDAVA